MSGPNELRIWHEHQLIARFSGEHHSISDYETCELIVYKGTVEVRRFGRDEWSADAQPGDDGVCAGTPGVDCDYCAGRAEHPQPQLTS